MTRAPTGASALLAVVTVDDACRRGTSMSSFKVGDLLRVRRWMPCSWTERSGYFNGEEAEITITHVTGLFAAVRVRRY